METLYPPRPKFTPVTDIDSKPRIWNQNAGIISFFFFFFGVVASTGCVGDFTRLVL